MKELSVYLDIIECKSMNFNGKDMITIKNKADFLKLCKDKSIIYKLKNWYHIISDSVVWVYQE